MCVVKIKSSTNQHKPHAASQQCEEQQALHQRNSCQYFHIAGVRSLNLPEALLKLRKCCKSVATSCSSKAFENSLCSSYFQPLRWKNVLPMEHIHCVVPR